jgi:Cd2+/Zn2+-exporting ATPase
VKIGEIIVIKAGEKIPLDAVVIEGDSTVDTSALTASRCPERFSETRLF